MRHLALSLRDAGAGLYRVRVDVDGERMTELPIDENQGACKRPFVRARAMQACCGDRRTCRHDAARRRPTHDSRSSVRRNRRERRHRRTDLAHGRQSARPSAAWHLYLPSNECGECSTAAQDQGRSVWPISVHRRTRLGISGHPQERPGGRRRQRISQRAAAPGAAWAARSLQDRRPPEADHPCPAHTRLRGGRGASLRKTSPRQGESRGSIRNSPASSPERGDDSPGRARAWRISAGSREDRRDRGARTRRGGVDDGDSASHRLAWTVSVRVPLPKDLHHHDLRVSWCRPARARAIRIFADGHPCGARR